jgi:predicted SAM-dependent methyltransferase
VAREHRGLNWGCGPLFVKGWWNSDVVDYGQEHVGNIVDGLPCRDGFFDGIIANHSLQCLTYDELDPAAAEFKRALRPGGRLRVLVPSVTDAFRARMAGDSRWPGFEAIAEDWDLDRKFCHYLTWGGSNRSCFTEFSLTDLCERHGFTRSAEWWAANATDSLEHHDWAWLRELDSRVDESIVVEMVA